MAIGRRLHQFRLRLVGRSPSDYAQELEEFLKRMFEQGLGIPSGWFASTPPTIQAGTTADPGSGYSAGWQAADATIAIETGVPSNPTGKTASEGTGTALMRSTAIVAQGIVTRKGDLLAHDGVTAERLPGGLAGQVLSMSPGDPTGHRWIDGLTGEEVTIIRRELAVSIEDNRAGSSRDERTNDRFQSDMRLFGRTGLR